ncbi:hypothetical protein [Streptomyces iconiensis]|uniref:Uncharacterized protein n=1 Tax=Streptomyces iconiensis TaxID=1384038 RepID=A0ABT6ZQG3_9ACTN|nr:hypothetical protein [Streptomyces iconiensis]MDJ1131281.1 hypothetical protein [Streptomyces iconiensis]
MSRSFLSVVLRRALFVFLAAPVLFSTVGTAHAQQLGSSCAPAECGRSVVVAPLSQAPPSQGTCTSPEKVVCTIRSETPEEREESRAIRMRYHELIGDMDRTQCAMRREGHSDKAIARRLVQMRNDAKDVTRAGMSPEQVRRLEERNVAKYGNPLGPTADQLHAKYGSWEAVSAAALRTSDAVDSELGLEYRPCPCDVAP